MLNEQIEHCKYLGNSKGLLFLLDSINSGVKSRASLYKLYSHNIVSAELDIDAGLLLLSYLNLIQYDGDKIIKGEQIDALYSNNDCSALDSFAKVLCHNLIEDGVVDIDRIAYDSADDSFYLPFNAFQRKYAVYRNLLQTLSVLKMRPDGGFTTSDILTSYIQSSKKRNKLSQEKLLKMIEAERIQGENGEIFVVQYEKIRLQAHPHVNKIKRISLLDAAAGYDVISYNSESSTKLDRMIEVKTYKGNAHFYWSANEIGTAKLVGDNYYLYLVDIDKINDENYEPHIIKNPAAYFDKNAQWITRVESYYFERLNVDTESQQP
jgi:hypothetical protein